MLKIASGIVFITINPQKKKLAGKMIFGDFRAILRFRSEALVSFPVQMAEAMDGVGPKMTKFSPIPKSSKNTSPYIKKAYRGDLRPKKSFRPKSAQKRPVRNSLRQHSLQIKHLTCESLSLFFSEPDGLPSAG